MCRRFKSVSGHQKNQALRPRFNRGLSFSRHFHDTITRPLRSKWRRNNTAPRFAPVHPLTEPCTPLSLRWAAPGPRRRALGPTGPGPNACPGSCGPPPLRRFAHGQGLRPCRGQMRAGGAETRKGVTRRCPGRLRRRKRFEWAMKCTFLASGRIQKPP